MKYFLIFLIKFYKKHISPMLSPSCRFYPSCSSYSLEAVEKYGAFKGGGLAIYRILRCQPFSKGGLDPVPDTENNSQTNSNKDSHSHNHSHNCQHNEKMLDNENYKIVIK